VGSYATGISYHPNGAIASFRYGNSILHTLGQNARGLPEVSQDAGIVKDTYAYDANGNVTSITDGQEGGLTNRGMDYDNLDRLLHVKAAGLWGDAWYTYDALDNLVASRFTAGGTARDLTHAIDPLTNRLKSITNSAGGGYNFGFDYDDQGNIKQRGSQAFVFDMANRLTSAPGKGTYVYDGLGHRVSVVGTDGVNRIQVYSQAGQLLYVKASNAATGTKYIHLHNHVIAEVTGNSVQYDHTDGLGSPVALTDAAGKLISRTRYEPYGQTAAGATPVIGFTGHVNAPDIGLAYMQQRYYDPVAGRFLSIDPVVTDANTGSSFNRYSYGDNSPYKYTDPDGRGPVGWVVILYKNGRAGIGRALASHAEAVAARKAGENVQMVYRSSAKAVETAANGGDAKNILRHDGHQLPNGGTGNPHFQTEGTRGHTFWGKLSAVYIGLSEGMDVAKREILEDIKSDPIGAICWLCGAGNESNDSDVVESNPAVVYARKREAEKNIRCGISCETGPRPERDQSFRNRKEQ
jgi:RHS repeat-associated protein